MSDVKKTEAAIRLADIYAARDKAEAVLKNTAEAKRMAEKEFYQNGCVPAPEAARRDVEAFLEARRGN